MLSNQKNGVLLTLMAFAMAAILIEESGGRYLRPSDHGLQYQNSPTAKESPAPEMVSFFGPPSSDVELPEAENSSESSGSTWWEGKRKNGKEKKEDKTRKVLVITSLACGVAGVALFAVSAFLYFLSSKTHPSPPPVATK